MDRDRILAMNRAEQQDEGMDHAQRQGAFIGYQWMSAVYGVLSIINLIAYSTGREGAYGFDVASAMYFCFVACVQFQKYRFTGEKKRQVYGILWAIVSLFFVVLYLVRLLWK